MHIYHDIRYPRRVQHMLIRDPEFIGVRLDPAKRGGVDEGGRPSLSTCAAHSTAL